MRKEFITNRQGKEFCLFAGLLDQAHQEGLKRITTKLLQAPLPENGGIAICWAEVETDKGVFCGIGDADDHNVGRMIVAHKIRMAETRAKGRALRDAINVAMVSVEELGDLDDAPAATPTRQAPRQQPTPITQATKWKNSDPAPQESIDKWRHEASLVADANGPKLKIADGATVGQLVAFKAEVEKAQAAMLAAQDALEEPGQVPANPPTQAQIDRLHKMQAALGQPAMVSSTLTSDEAAAKIADLVRRFNAQARDANRTGSK